MAKDLVIIVTPLGGTITQIGSDIARGVWVEDASWEHSLVDHGALRAQFTLRRRPEQEWPDLQPFTPIVIMKSGSVAWSGRVQETPTSRGMDNLITVQCEGWPMHMKDDALQKLFVHNDLAAWKDARALPGASPSTFTSAFQVDTGGLIQIRVPNGTASALNKAGGVAFDAGQFSTVKSVLLTYIGGGLANYSLRYNAGDTPNAATETGTIDLTPIATISTQFNWSFTTPRRYITIYMQDDVGTAVAVDTAWVQLTNIVLVSDTSYTSGGVSILKASQVASAILPYAPKISQSTTGITTTAFSIPHFTGPATSPADYIDAANAYHLYQWFLKDDAAGGPPSLVYQPIPTSPTIVANVGAGIVFEDASRNDGGDIYNRVLVDYTDAAGNAALEERTSAGLPAAIADPDIVFDLISPGQPANPSFTVDTSNWVVTTGTLTRDAGVFDSTPASALVASNGAGNAAFQSAAFSGLVAGKRYTLQYRVRANAGWLAGTMQCIVNSSASVTLGTDTFTNAIGAAAFTTRSITFTYPAGSTSLTIAFLNSGAVTAAANLFYVDSFVVLESRATIVDRQGFVRTRVLTTSSRLTAAAADQIGDVFLQAHRFTPLRGTLTVQGSALRTMTGDIPIPAHLIARRLGDAVLINETDPDFGVIGRVGNISNVAYDEPSDTAVVAIDNRKDFIDALLARVAVFTGSS